ncbi:carbohydrate-binding family 9-like protein [Flavobacteriaceae bacterium F89]|uniref:Carbohydrate-binding family 9-like protein n=1 Tax=Cerina litoralis TaxID=2874477 RepID=A0AAE3JMZ4_9FLAO|nr:carbohydrate-binding family 9-like protein [Cerina litoralis]MCG2459316.1 carbohydrate-binding family 9-like protein [Cerina litoralis]
MKQFYNLKLWLCIVLVIIMSDNSLAQNNENSKKTGSHAGVDIANTEPLLVKKCSEFEITGNGSDPEWNKTKWAVLTQLDQGGGNYASKFKIMYSDKGIYILFQGQDEKITTEDYEDMDALWNGDVFEAFFHPDPQKGKYYEYEVNPMGKQIVITLFKSEEGLVSWIPMNKQNRKSYGVESKVEISGGKMELDSKITSWRAEMFLSYKSMGLIPNIPPKSGATWNANFCRLDYDYGKMIKWSWSPTIEKSFHELEKFRSIKFE